MKKIILLLFIPIFFTCSDDNNSSNSASYLGSYRGNIDVFMPDPDTYHSTLYNHTISFVSIDNSDEILIDGNLIITNVCTINGDNLIIEENIPVSTSSFYAVEYGTGTFNGDQLEIELRQYNYDNSGTLNFSGTWIGTLTKMN